MGLGAVWLACLAAALGAPEPPAVEVATVPPGGQTVASSDAWQLRPGFTIDLEFRLAEAGGGLLLAKEGEYLVRLDPAAEGGNLSVFLNLDGTLEPRLRTVSPTVGGWHRLLVAWDGVTLLAMLDGQSFRQARRGAAQPGEAPVVLGGLSPWAGPLPGELRAIRILHRAVTEGERLADLLGLADAPGDGTTQTRFDLTQGAQGWRGVGTGPVTAAAGGLAFESAGPASGLVRSGLALPLTGAESVGLRLQVAGGSQARLVYATSHGTGTVGFDVLGDGLPHTYLIPVHRDGAWQGTLRALAVLPSDQPGAGRLAVVEIAATSSLPPEVAIESLFAEPVIPRAGRPLGVVAQLVNRGGPGRGLQARLAVEGGVALAGDEPPAGDRAAGERWTERWSLTAAAPGPVGATLEVTGDGLTPARRSLAVTLGPAVAAQTLDYVPPPQPVKARGDLLIGAQICPLWKTGARAQVWEPLLGWPERTPALGYYDEGSPEVTDWEIRWCLEHGIDYFVYCWYRAQTGAPVEQRLSHGIHEGLFNARYGDQFRFAIMWENGNAAGVADAADLFDNLLPYWIETYFRRDNYLTVEGRPVLYIYRPEKLVPELGGVAATRAAFERMRRVCAEAGLGGLWILGEYRGLEPQRLAALADLGLDASFAYCWPLPHDPSSAEAVDGQVAIWQQRQALGILPDVLTVSMGWDSRPWHPTTSRWRLTPDDFRRACEAAVAAAETRPADSLGRRMILLDNWNEYGEGHYLAPHREYGFGYLDAVRAAFCDAPAEHVDLVPEDVGRGPYDSLFRAAQAQAAAAAKIVRRPGGDTPGLLAWYTFDGDGPGLAYDSAGHGRGGVVPGAHRAAGRVGQALVCDGAAVQVPADDAFAPPRGFTVEAWIRTETGAQSEAWFVNRISSANTAGGFRLGLTGGGRLVFQVPVTSWSHQLRADEPLPLGRWVHVAGVCDGLAMVLYQDGQLVGTLPRVGAVRETSAALVLGNYAPGHSAHFRGLLDEVRLWDRALSAAEIAARAAGG